MGYRHDIIACVLCALLAGCTDTDLSNDRFFCGDDIDCKTGYACHPAEKTCVLVAELPESGLLDASTSADQSTDALPDVSDAALILEVGTGAPGCSNGKRDPGETGPDCGGECAPCVEGQGCVEPTDCTSSVCDENVCQPPRCGDGVTNGEEAFLLNCFSLTDYFPTL